MSDSPLPKLSRNRIEAEYGGEILAIRHDPDSGDAVVTFRDGRRRTLDTHGHPAPSRSTQPDQPDPRDGLLPPAVAQLLATAHTHEVNARTAQQRADQLRQSAIRALRKQGMTTAAAITAITLWDKLTTTISTTDPNTQQSTPNQAS